MRLHCAWGRLGSVGKDNSADCATMREPPRWERQRGLFVLSFEVAKQPPAPSLHSGQNTSLLWVAARTDVGHKRQNNEDSYLVLDSSRRILSQPAGEGLFHLRPSGSLLAVADGMD